MLCSFGISTEASAPAVLSLYSAPTLQLIFIRNLYMRMLHKSVFTAVGEQGLAGPCSELLHQQGHAHQVQAIRRRTSHDINSMQ